MKWCDYILLVLKFFGSADNRKGRKVWLRMLMMGTSKFLKLIMYLIEKIPPPTPKPGGFIKKRKENLWRDCLTLASKIDLKAVK